MTPSELTFRNVPSVQRRLTSISSHVHSSQTQAGSRLKIVVTRNLGPDVMPLLHERGDLDVVLWPEDRVADRKWLLENIPGAAGVVVMINDKVDKELLETAGPSLRVASTMSVGYEHVDISELGKRGIKFGFTPDVLTGAVADLSVMLALMAGRNAGEVITLVQDSKWPASPWAPFAFCGPQLSTSSISPKRTVGFLGFGRISQATLARLIPFGITDCIYSSNPSSQPTPSRDVDLAKQHRLNSLKRVNADELARESDVLFVLAPGGPTTRHLVNEAFLKKMKKTSILINTSRGTLVDSDALGKALREGWIWGAGLDVVEGEPHITADHVLVKEPRCVVLPHIGSATLETRIGMATLAVKNLLAALDGVEMPASVDLSNRS